MPERPAGWAFTVLGIEAPPYAAAPELTARVRVERADEARVHAVALRCQVRIEPQRRGYTSADERGLRSLFDRRERWPQTMRPFLWMQCHTTVQGFAGTTETDLPLPCTYDFDVTGSRYLHAVDAGTVPLTFLFSGTAFVRGESGFAVEQVPWDSEARYDLPVRVWRDMLAAYFPHRGWIRLDHDVLAGLGDFRARHGLVSWEETVTRLLALAEAESAPVAAPVGEEALP
ncbi:MAG: DUF6084 family protein [Nocardioidaceae bacterium]